MLTGGNDISRLAQQFSDGIALRNINNQQYVGDISIG
jgi:hypothetical protein